MAFLKHVSLLGLGLWLGYSSPSFGQQCDAILRYGVFDVQNAATDVEAVSAFSNFLRQQDFESLQHATDRGFSLAAVLKMVPLNLGAHDRDTHFREWSHALETTVQSDQSLRRQLVSEIKIASPTIVNAWRECLSQPGFKGGVTIGSDPHQFRLSLRTNPIGPLTKATLDLDPTFSTGISCKPAVLARGYVVDHNEKQFLCTRSSRDAGSVIINTDVGPIAIDLRPIAPPPELVNVKLSTTNMIANSAAVRYPVAEAKLSPGANLMGGGCAVSYANNGSSDALVMVQSTPAADGGWICKGADPPNRGIPGTATATAIQLMIAAKRPSLRLQRIARSEPSRMMRYPQVVVELTKAEQDEGYVVVSGGCESAYYGAGAAHATPIVQSEPTPDLQGWVCKAADPPDLPVVTRVTAHLVAVHLIDVDASSQYILPRLEVAAFRGQPANGSNPGSHAAVPAGYVLTGGGCTVSYASTGSKHAVFAVRNTLEKGGWICQGADPPGIGNPGTATAVAVGLRVRGF